MEDNKRWPYYNPIPKDGASWDMPEDTFPVFFDEPTTKPIIMQDVATKIIEQFLIDISCEIEQIDGGCSGCINDFITGVNETIKEYNLKLFHNENRRIEVLQIKST